MPFQKGEPRPPMRVKTCAICRKSFQPNSGAQRICGEPECKARSRMQKYLDRKASQKKSEDHHQDETREERLARIDRENPIPARKNFHSETDIPGLE